MLLYMATDLECLRLTKVVASPDKEPLSASPRRILFKSSLKILSLIGMPTKLFPEGTEASLILSRRKRKVQNTKTY